MAVLVGRERIYTLGGPSDIDIYQCPFGHQYSLGFGQICRICNILNILSPQGRFIAPPTKLERRPQKLVRSTDHIKIEHLNCGGYFLITEEIANYVDSSGARVYAHHLASTCGKGMSCHFAWRGDNISKYPLLARLRCAEITSRVLEHTYRMSALARAPVPVDFYIPSINLAVCLKREDEDEMSVIRQICKERSIWYIEVDLEELKMRARFDHVESSILVDHLLSRLGVAEGDINKTAAKINKLTKKIGGCSVYPALNY